MLQLPLTCQAPTSINSMVMLSPVPRLSRVSSEVADSLGILFEKGTDRET